MYREREIFSILQGTKCFIAERRTTELLLHSSNVSTLLWLLDKNKNTSYHYIVKTTNVYCGAPQRCGRQELSSPHNKYSILYTILTDLHEVVFVLPHVSKVECIGSSRTWCRGRLVLTSVGFMSEGSWGRKAPGSNGRDKPLREATVCWEFTAKKRHTRAVDGEDEFQCKTRLVHCDEIAAAICVADQLQCALLSPGTVAYEWWGRRSGHWSHIRWAQ